MAPSKGLPGLRVVGLLGGVGSGKSTVARAIAGALPGAVLDADEEVARLLDDPAVAARVEAAVPGVRTPGGAVDRQALARRAFADEDARRRLEAVLHPGVRQALHGRLEALEAAGKTAWAVLDVPLLLESGLDAACDLLVFVAAPAAERARRSSRRHGWTEEEWRAREAAQRPLEEKEAAADVILDNGGSPEQVRERIQALLETMRALPPRPLRERWPSWDQAPSRRRP